MRQAVGPTIDPIQDAWVVVLAGCAVFNPVHMTSPIKLVLILNQCDLSI